MENLGASQNGQPGSANAGQGQGATGTTTFGDSAIGRAALEAMGFRVRRLPAGFCLRFYVFL